MGKNLNVNGRDIGDRRGNFEDVFEGFEGVDDECECGCGSFEGVDDECEGFEDVDDECGSFEDVFEGFEFKDFENVRVGRAPANTPPRQVPRTKSQLHKPLLLLPFFLLPALSHAQDYPVPPDTYSRTKCNRILSKPHSWSICDYHEEKRLEHVLRRMKTKNPRLFEPAQNPVYELPAAEKDYDLDINDF